MALRLSSPLHNPSSLLSCHLCSASVPCGRSAGTHGGMVAGRGGSADQKCCFCSLIFTNSEVIQKMIDCYN